MMRSWSSAVGGHVLRLLAVILAGLILVEALARVAVPRISRIESRVTREREEARHLGARGAGPPPVLIVGNSLLLFAVDVDGLQQRLSPEWRLHRFVIESSGYVDWYFGLRNLFERGNRPAAVVLMLSADQLVSDEIRGTYSAYHLFSLRDSVAAGVRAHMHPTEISGLVLGNLSAFYGIREDIRKFALQKVVPGAAGLAALSVAQPRRSGSMDPGRLDREARARLAELSSLCAAYEVRCLFARTLPARG
jgi:hypothetical protein